MKMGINESYTYLTNLQIEILTKTITSNPMMFSVYQELLNEAVNRPKTKEAYEVLGMKVDENGIPVPSKYGDLTKE